MKKAYFLTGILSVLLFVSCKKSGTDKQDDGAPAANTFVINGESFSVGNAKAIDESSIQASGLSNNIGYGINIAFFEALPTTGGTFTIMNKLTKPGQMCIHIATNGGSKMYVSLDGTQTGTVTVDAQGKITVKFSNIELGGSNVNGIKGVSANIIKP
jgi:hypothetical protein